MNGSLWDRERSACEQVCTRVCPTKICANVSEWDKTKWTLTTHLIFYCGALLVLRFKLHKQSDPAATISSNSSHRFLSLRLNSWQVAQPGLVAVALFVSLFPGLRPSAEAGRQAGRRCGRGQRGWCVCQRGALPHSPGGWQQAGPAEGGSPLSHDLSGSCAHLGAIHFLPENSLPLQLQKEEGGGGRAERAGRENSLASK